LIQLTKNSDVVSKIWGKCQELLRLCYKEHSLCAVGFFRP